MSDLHSETAAPRSKTATGPATDATNDTAALNGGPAQHWFAPGVKEARPTPRITAKLGSALLIWGGLLVFLLILMALV